MNCIMVFDNLNDVLFLKYNEIFCKHFQKLGRCQGLISSNEQDYSLNSNVLMQIFSPLVTSQRIMSSQFGNSYTSVQCQDGINIVFDEYVGFLFLCIGSDPVSYLQHTLSIFISFVRHLCGPDVTELKTNEHSKSLLNSLFDAWLDLRSNDQAYLVEALEQFSVNPEITSTVINTLKGVCKSLCSIQSTYDCSRCHSLIFCENRLLSLFTSRESEDLTPSDVLFLNILSNSYKHDKIISSQSDVKDNSHNDVISPISSTDQQPLTTDTFAIEAVECIDKMNNEVVLLQGKKIFIPHVVHLADFGNGVILLLLYQICHESFCIGFDEVFSSIAKFNKLVGSDADVETQKKVFESLENGMKRILECLKKVKNKQEMEPISKQLQLKWDHIKKKYIECCKNNEEIGINLLASTSHLLTTLRQFYQAMCLTTTAELPVNHASVLKVVQDAQLELLRLTDFFKEKTFQNFTLKSRALLTINKYLEEFPGLVHFLYIDRSNHRVTAPFLQFSSDDTTLLATKKIWEMVDLSRNHIKDGHFAFMWKDTTFNYAYYLWFEDQSGASIKPKINPANVVKSLPMPGILAGDFYKGLIDACFPKMNGKVRCYELYCVHLGLATSSSVLDQSRRIAATIWEVTGQKSNNPNFF